jgi:hypothetical protein
MIESNVMVFKGVLGIPGAMIELLNGGYQAPCDGDRCQIDMRLSLPADEKGNLVADYQFGEAIKLCGIPLTSEWGKKMVQGLRTVQTVALADTWPEGFEGSLKQLAEELKPMKAALDARKERVKQANWP